MSFRLENIPGLSEEEQTVHQIRALAFGGRNPAKKALLEWQKNCPNEWKKLMRGIRFAGAHARNELLETNYAERCDNAEYGEIYEFRNNRCPLRLMFFFDRDDQTLIVCTNDYQKSDAQRTKSGGQDTAFEKCAKIRDAYYQHGVSDEED